MALSTAADFINGLIADTQLALVLSVTTPPVRTVDLARRLVDVGTRLLDRAQNPRAPDYAEILDRCLRLHLFDNRSDEEQGNRFCKLGPHPLNEEWDARDEEIWRAVMDLLERLNRSGALAGSDW